MKRIIMGSVLVSLFAVGLVMNPVKAFAEPPYCDAKTIKNMTPAQKNQAAYNCNSMGGKSGSVELPGMKCQISCKYITG